MPYLSLTLLGGFEATLDAEPVAGFVTNKDRALLAFLAIEAFRPHRRPELAAMFWPDASEKKAAHSLSQGLLHLRKALGGSGSASAPFLLITPQDVQFNGFSDYHLDVARFRELLSLSDRHVHADPADCGTCHKWLEEAAALYRGDLLAGLFLPSCEKFEEWRLVQQEDLHHQALEALEQLASYCERRSDWSLAQEYARRQITLEPWRETAHYQLMRALVQNGQKSAALKQFGSYTQILSDELGLEPSGEIRKLYEQIRSGGTAPSEPLPAGESVWLPGHGERRQVTTLVCSRRSSRELEEGPEQELACERYCEPIFKRFGGRRAPRQGAACLVYFGYPQAFEDAARRAVHTGLAMAPAQDGVEAARIGIHTGVTLVGEGRTPRWQDRDLSGLSLDVARDCQRWAQPGQVLVTEDTRKLVQDAFRLEKLPIVLPVEPGKHLPVFRVEEELGLQSRLDWLAETQRLTPYTGREMELSRLESCHEALLQGTGHVVLVTGDPGIGKSRLLWEFKRKLDGSKPAQKDFSDRRSVLWLESHCLPHFQNTNLHPISDLLEQLVGIQPGDSLDARREKLKANLAWYGMSRPATLWLLSTLLGLQTEVSGPQTVTSAQREQMRQACLELIKKRAVEQPLMLLIEDLHWSDPSTVDWIEKSVTALAASPCLVLFTTRPGFTPTWLAQQPPRAELLLLGLTPLAQQQVEDMVSGLAGDSRLEADLYRHIVTHTDGIPLYIEELAKALLEHPTRRSNTGPESKFIPEIPATLQDSLAARLDALGTAKETAQWAAVLGREFDLSVLQLCVPYDGPRLQDDLARLIQAELITPVGTSMQEAMPVPLAKQAGRRRAHKAPVRYSFKHALLQDAIYDSLLRRTRREYHVRIAEILQAQFPELSQSLPEVVAQHYAEAGMQLQAADFWLQAGERSTAQGATLEALTFFNRAMEVLKQEDYQLRWRALEGREHVFDLQVDRESQGKDIEELLDLAEAFDDDGRRIQALLRQMQYALRRNDFPLMLKVAETARAKARRLGNRSFEVQALACKVHGLTSTGEQALAHELAEETLAYLSEVADAGVRANVLGEVALYYRSLGDLSLAMDLLRRATEAAREIGDRRRECRNAVNIGFICIQLGLYPQARAVLEEGMALADMIGERGVLASSKDNLSFVYWSMGERLTAIALSEQLLEEFRTSIPSPFGVAACLAQLGFFQTDMGNWSMASIYLEEARKGYSALGAKQDSLEQQGLEARCQLNMSHQKLAGKLAGEVWSYLRQYGSAGFSFPARVYLDLADVFTSIESPSAAAQDLIEAGYHDLMQRAGQISNPEWRKSFLENVAENRKIVERWKRLIGNQSFA
jgi:DNA-binding SARP family transcriptional activator/tetratricopeptide (TPR) repeat protein